MKRQQQRRIETRRPSGMMLRLQQAWRHDGEKPQPARKPPAAPKTG